MDSATKNIAGSNSDIAAMPVEAGAGTTADTAAIDFVARILKEAGSQKNSLIAILQEIQHKYRYLPQDLLEYLAGNSQYSEAAIMESATFYSMFRLKPAGRHTISVCAGTACHIKGADLIFDSFKGCLQIEKNNDTDKKRMYTIEKVACLGCCAIAPAIRIDDEITGFVAPENASLIITQFQNKNNQGLFLPPSAGVENNNNFQYINICLCSACTASGAAVLWQNLDEIIVKQKLPFVIKSVGCTGESHKAPLMEITDTNGNINRYNRPKKYLLTDILYSNCEAQKTSRIIRNKLFASVNRLNSLYTGYDEEVLPDKQKDDFFKNNQTNIATEHKGLLSPLDYDEYKANGGLAALDSVLEKKYSGLGRNYKEEQPAGKGWRWFYYGYKN